MSCVEKIVGQDMRRSKADDDVDARFYFAFESVRTAGSTLDNEQTELKRAQCAPVAPYYGCKFDLCFAAYTWSSRHRQ